MTPEEERILGSASDAEVARRGLNSDAEAGQTAEGAPGTERPGEGQELVLIATYNIPDEANLAWGLLESAQIPWSLQNEYSTLAGFQLRLLVPAAFEEQALEVLDTPISDEELAAQAEAAAVVEDESEEN